MNSAPDLSSLPPVLTAAEAAEILRVPESQIYRLCRRNELRHVRLGRWVRIPRDVVLDLLGMSDSKTLASTDTAKTEGR